MTSPVPGSTLPGSSVTFRWTTASGINGYYLEVGTSSGTHNIYNAYQGTRTSATVNNVPVSGAAIYVKLSSRSSSTSQWMSRYYTYKAASSTPPPSTGSLAVSPTALSFGMVNVGSTAAQSFTATASSASVTVSQANFTGAAFSLSTPTLPVTIAAGQSATFAVRFAPAAAGSASDSLSLVSNASNSPATVALSGTGATATPPPTTSGGPTLFFSDLTWGPKTGWEGSTTKGAAITIWGKNFGAIRGTSYITVNGAQLNATTDYAEWDAVGPARGLERITFWLNNTATDGAGNITVTVNGVASNALPFTVAAGNIYFISPTGSNTNNGQFSTSQGGTNGPFHDIYMFGPNHNPSRDGQYIAYLRAGTYTTQDPAGDSAIISLRGPFGGPSTQKALVGYPGETPVIDSAACSRGVVYSADWDPYGFNDYFTFAKLGMQHGTVAISNNAGNYWRIVGNSFTDYLDTVWAGVVDVSAAQYTSIFGNNFTHNGYDSFKHNIYIKTEDHALTLPAGRDFSTQHIFVGWNEFANPVASDVHGGVIFVSKDSASTVAAYPTQAIFIHDNYFHDGNQDFIYIGDNVPIGDVTIYNNVMNRGASSNGAITFQNGTGTVNLYNNTFYENGPSSVPIMAGTGAAKLHFKNNIWYSQAGQTFLNLETFQGATADFDHDLYFSGGGSPTAPSGAGMTQTSPLVKDPLFVNAAAGDFHLQSTSPAINAGTGAVNTVVTQDYDGRSRPQGSAFDIGPFER